MLLGETKQPSGTRAWGLGRIDWESDLVPGEGIEPTLPCGNQILSLARLPISPPRRWEQQYKGFPQSFQYSASSSDRRCRCGSQEPGARSQEAGLGNPKLSHPGHALVCRKGRIGYSPVRCVRSIAVWKGHLQRQGRPCLLRCFYQRCGLIPITVRSP